MQFKAFDEGVLYWQRDAPDRYDIILHLDDITEIGMETECIL